MIYGYARVSTDGQSVGAQVRQLAKAGCKKVFRETASGAKTDRTQLRKALEQIDAGDVLMVTKLDRLGTLDAGSPEHPRDDRRSQRRLPVSRRRMGRYHQPAWAPHADCAGRVAEFERELIRARTGEGRARAKARGVKWADRRS